MKYFSRQLSCKKKVALQERNAELDGFPQLRHWFRIVDVRKEVLEVTEAALNPLTLTGHLLSPLPRWQGLGYTQHRPWHTVGLQCMLGEGYKISGVCKRDC